MEPYTEEGLTARLADIRGRGWIPNARPDNPGGIGNTLEDLLGIEENNLPMANAGVWELKCQRAASGALTTLFHMEPLPRGARVVPRILLPLYGWPHQTIRGEQSFRQTINGVQTSDRGFKVVVDRGAGRILVSFDAAAVAPRHAAWLRSVAGRAGAGELDPQPYWDFAEVHCKAARKLLNCFYVRAEAKREEGREWFRYTGILVLRDFRFDRFLRAIEHGALLIDFDARSGHNHGTKFRLRQDRLPELYERVRVI